MHTIHIEKTARVADKYDVVVCGGGPAGFIAAVAAARLGASTALIERYGFLGGMATAGLIAPLSVFTYNGEKVIGGLPWDFVERLVGMGGGLVEEPLGNIAFDPELYKLCVQRMVQEAGVKVFAHSYISGCRQEGNEITHVIMENKSGTEALEGRMFVDCTGDADLAHMAGVPMQPQNGEPLQPASLIFVLSGVDTDSPLISQAMHHNRQGVNCHCLPIREALLARQQELGLPEFGGPWFCTLLHDGTVAVNMTRVAADACDNRNFAAAEMHLREDAFRMAQILKEHFPEFRHSYISATAVQAGPRETRRILGAHTITAAEYLNAVRYEDSVSRGAHPIDIHVANGPSQGCHFLEKPAYVPYRALYAHNFPNLLVGGRCISADRQAFASLRVQASCMGTGQAAGVAAAQCVQSGKTVLQADTAMLMATLRQWGAVI
ncbi:MAG: FAD-dependent oxidoreductase [Bacteroidaceae bacterium]|nr:FAD-dependent oxidoreductase [Bacteroidaceae bacterium]